jgi:hypothetical protein
MRSSAEVPSDQVNFSSVVLQPADLYGSELPPFPKLILEPYVISGGADLAEPDSDLSQPASSSRLNAEKIRHAAELHPAFLSREIRFIWKGINRAYLQVKPGHLSRAGKLACSGAGLAESLFQRGGRAS